jgi:hypothetical protein
MSVKMKLDYLYHILFLIIMLGILIIYILENMFVFINFSLLGSIVWLILIPYSVNNEY